MTRVYRLTALSMLGFLLSCSSPDSGGDSPVATPTTGTTAGAGSSTSTGNAVTGVTPGSTATTNDGTGGAGTTSGSATSGAATTSAATTSAATTAGPFDGTGSGGTPSETTSTTDTGSETTSTTGMGGQGTTASGESTTGGLPSGEISVDDPVPGFASVAGGTTGGGTNIGSAIVVSSMGELNNAASGSNPALILVEPGDYNGTLAPGSNKTIIGTGQGVTVNGNIMINDASNIIIRNLAVRGNRCNSYDECKAGADGVYVGNGAHHVWLDHLDIADGQDGNLDITQGGDYVTVSWTHFHYTYAKEHRYSNLIAGSDNEPNSVGKLHITYMTSHWGEGVDQRQPRGRFGNIHMLNNYHNTGGSAIHGVGVDMALIAENSVYDEHQSIWKDMGSPRGWQGIGNEGTASGLNDSRGTVFDIPYDYTKMPASEVVAAVTSPDCGAGNTCTLANQ